MALKNLCDVGIVRRHARRCVTSRSSMWRSTSTPFRRGDDLDVALAQFAPIFPRQFRRAGQVVLPDGLASSMRGSPRRAA